MSIDTLLDIMEARAERHPDRLAFCFLEDDAGRASPLSYAQLFERSRAIAGGLQAMTRPGDRVLLLYPPSIDYIAAFFGCVLAGVIPVPAYPPVNSHHAARIRTIVADAGAAVVIADGPTGVKLRDSGQGSRPIEVPLLDELEHGHAHAWRRPAMTGRDTAFLQYTSGSTSAPRGVVVTHGNLLHNLATLKSVYLTGEHSRFGSWLPPYHDMGLIGCILLPAFSNAPTYFISPIRFIQKPMRWLAAISRYQVTISASPNFGYEYCIQRATPENIRGLDLRSWEVACSGAEPVRPSTLASFAETFAPCGFDAKALRVGYGLAESTLLVAGGPPVVTEFVTAELDRARAVPATGSDARRPLVGVTTLIPDQQMVIVDPATRRRCEPGHVGEIWLQSPSVADGYWDNADKTAETFRATLADEDAGYFLRTGDLGFLTDATLYVTGRLKELIIIRGANYYPQDLEAAAAASHAGVSAEQTVAFSAEIDGAEQLILAIEVTRPFMSVLDELQAAVRDAIVRDFGIAPFAVVPVKRGALPKTSSGKKERATTRQRYLRGELVALTQTPGGDSGQAKAPPRSAPAAAPAASAPIGASAAIERWLVERIAAQSGVPAHAINPEEPFARYGFDSVKAVELTGALQDHLGYKLAPTLSFEFPSPRLLASHLGDAAASPADAASPAQAVRAAGAGPVAIVGMGCRFPGAHGVAAYWDLLRRGVDAITGVPADRWDADAYCDPDGKRAGSMVSRTAGFIDEVDQFDREFFGISPREAEQMDPQQRILLQTVWEALENAGIPPDSLSGSRTAVFVGISGHDYSLLQGSAGADMPYITTGNSASIAANRVSYFFNLVGPSMSVDTACSSSLVAVQLACQSLARGEVDVAIAAGVNLILSPTVSVSFSRAGILSPDGRCKAFDHRANGIGRAEGAGVVVLKPLSRAITDGDHVYAAILGGATNQDGRSNGLTAPNLASQVAVLSEAYRNAGVAPRSAGYVEAHGTGTPLGDPIECQALGRVLSVDRPGEEPCRIGSVKTNLGHLEAAAGIAGLMKVALAIEHRALPASLHYEAPNPHIDFDVLKLRVQAAHGPWPGLGAPLVAGVSSFGFGGSNVHLVVAEPEGPRPQAARALAAPADPARGVLALSARSEPALTALARRYAQHLSAHPDTSADDLCYTAGHRRTHHRVRAAVHFATRAELVEGLDALARGADSTRVTRGLRSGDPPKLAFVFSGQGSQWRGMGLGLAAAVPRFRETLRACAHHIQAHAGWSLLDELAAEGNARVQRDVAYVQPAIFAVQVALASVWRSWGVTPAAVIGHSMGEVTAAHVAGAIDLEDAVRIICDRSRLIADAQGHGGMACVELSLDEALTLIRPYGDRVSVAAANGPRETILSGDVGALREIGEGLNARDMFFEFLKVDLAGHSAHVDPARRQLVEHLAGLAPRATTVPLFSTVTARQMPGTELDAAHWGRNLREPVQFYAAAEQLVDFGCDAFLEISPHPLLITSVAQLMERRGSRGRVVAVPSMRRGDDGAVLREGFAALYAHGVVIAWDAVCPSARHLPDLPTYAWQTERCWFSAAPSLGPSAGSHVHPLLGEERPLAACDARVWDSVLSAAAPGYLADHTIDGVPVFPGVGFVESALRAIATSHDDGAIVLEDVAIERPLVLDPARRAQATLRGQDFTVHSAPVTTRAAASWERHAVLRARPTTELPALPARGIATLRASCEHAVDVDAFYRGAAARGLTYGPEFRRIRELWQGPQVAFGRIDTQHIPQAALHAAYPGVLDSALQILGAAIPAERVGQSTLVPTAIGQVHCLAQLPSGEDLLCYAELSALDRRGEARGNLHLVTASGRVCASITDVVLRPIAAGGVKADWFYETAWHEHGRPAEAAPDTPEGARYELLLIVTDVEPWQPLAHLLSAQGHLCTWIRAESSDACARELAAVPRVPHAIIDCRAPREVKATEHLPERATAACADALRLIQAVHARWPERGPVLWFVTSQAQSVTPGEACEAVAASPLWGLARAAMLEPIPVEIRLADFGRAAAADNVAAFAQDILAPDGENQLAYRGGRRFVARLEEAPAVGTDSAAFDAAASYLITGGLGGLGLEVAEWMVRRGARAVVLLGRRGPSEEALPRLEAMRAAGARVVTIQANVASRLELGRALDTLRRELPPLRGVVHAAGLLDDGFLPDQTPPRLARVLAPKVAGAWHLHELTEADALDFFVLFSSAASLIGSPGQTNYAAANAFLDALAHHRRAQGRPATSINWGPWSEIGLAATEARAGRLERQGVAGLATEQGLEALGRVLASRPAQIGVVPLRAPEWANSLPRAMRMPYFALLARRAGPDASRVSRQFMVEFLATEAAGQTAMLETYLHALIAEALRLSPAKLGLDDSLIGLGMDSITAVEIKNRIESGTGVALPILRFLGGATVRGVAQGLRTQLLLTSIRRDTLGGATPSIDRVRDLPIPRAPRADTYRLSPPQRRYAADFGWAPEASWSTVVLQAPAPVRCASATFEAAFHAVCARHDCLRTVFPEVNGERRQLIRDEPALTVAHEHHAELDAEGVKARMAALRREASRERWNTHDGPLGKLVLVSHGAGDANAILLSFHRVIMDGASVKLLVFDLVRAVHEIEAASPVQARGDQIRYRDFSEWLNDLSHAGHFLGARDYWRKELSGPLPDPFELNAKAARGARSTDAGLAVRLIPDADVARLRALAAAHGWLFPMMLFAMYALALRAAGGGSELVIDASLSGRHRPEFRTCLGFFTNAAAIRIHLAPALTFAEVVGEITRKFAAAEEHQYFQYNDVIDDLGLDRKATLFPLSGLLFNTITFDISLEQRAGARARWQPLSTQTRYGAMFYAMFHPECLSLELTHRLALMDEATANAILDAYVRLLDRLLSTGSECSVGDVFAA